MKGKLHKLLDRSWAILYTEQSPKSIIKEPIKQIPLHPDDAEYCMDIDDGNDIEFEIVKFGSKDDLIGKEYARILPLDEYEYPLLHGTNRLCDDIIAKRIAENSTYGTDPMNHPFMKGEINDLTAGEKAVELVAKYSRVLPMNQTTLLDHKNCALIAVDEIINSNPTSQISDPFLGNRTYENVNYWEQVKKEIEKL
jgi:hypothetical protein